MRKRLLILDFEDLGTTELMTLELRRLTDFDVDMAGDITGARQSFLRDEHSAIIVEPFNPKSPVSSESPLVKFIDEVGTSGRRVVITSTQPSKDLIALFGMYHDIHYDLYVQKPFRTDRDLVPALRNLFSY